MSVNSSRWLSAGVVTDDKGNPLAGATVRVKGTAVGRATDINGRFMIDAATGNTLIISFAGYTSQEVVVTKEGDLKIVLLEDNRMLNEVVVTALGMKKEKRSLGYSVTQVAGESLTTARENNVMNSLVGKVAGWISVLLLAVPSCVQCDHPRGIEFEPDKSTIIRN